MQNAGFYFLRRRRNNKLNLNAFVAILPSWHPWIFVPRSCSPILFWCQRFSRLYARHGLVHGMGILHGILSIANCSNGMLDVERQSLGHRRAPVKYKPKIVCLVRIDWIWVVKKKNKKKSKTKCWIFNSISFSEKLASFGCQPAIPIYFF